MGFRRLSFTTLIAGRERYFQSLKLNSNIDLHSSEYDINDSVMEPLTSVANNSAGTAVDSQNVSSNVLNRDVGLIKQKLLLFTTEHIIHQEWILLAHIINRLCFLIYLFFFSFSIGHHMFYK